MMFDRTSKGVRSLDSRWVEKAKIAKRTTSSLDQWSEREIARWDLDDPVREPTGAKNPRTWRYDDPLREVNRSRDKDERPDARENPTIRDAEDDGPFGRDGR